ncbi:hypothetical protein HY844_02930 [Candidatus Berkelbacteria bacterium]|nr:hypothetical protein [Candidatus Berkelbacteria bacterium]
MITKPTIIQLGYKNKPQDRFTATFVNSTLVLGKEVQLISIVEIKNAYHPARTSGMEIVQSFSRYFIRSTHQSTLTKFEDALKGCNTIIESAIKTLDSPINCAVLAISGNDVYLSTLGNAKIYLRRDGRLNQVSARIQEAEHGQFASVTNGEIIKGDWVFMANEELVNYLQEFEQDLPDDAIVLENQIKNFYAKFPETNFCGILINVEPDHPFQITLYLDEVDKKIPITLPKINIPAIEVPKLNFSKFSTFFAMLLKKFKKNSVINEEEPKIRKFPKFPKIKNIKIIGAVAVLLFVIIFFFRLPNNNQNNTSDQKANLLVSAINQTPVKITDIITNLNEVNYNALTEDERLQLVMHLKTNNLTFISPANIINKFDSDIVSVDAFDDLIIVVDKENNIWKITDKTPEKIEHKKTIVDIKSATVIYNDLVIISTSTNKYWKIILSENSANEIPISDALSGAQLIFETYNNNLYAYNPKNNTVFRALNFNGDLKKFAPYTKVGVLKNSNVTDIAINGDIISVSNIGSMERFVRNIPRQFVKRNDPTSENHLVALIPLIYRAQNNEISTYNDKTLKQDPDKYITYSEDKITSLSLINNRLLFSIGKNLYEINL